MSAPSVTGPHDVPNLRLYLLDRWHVGGIYEECARIMWSVNRQEYGWRPREESEWQRQNLGDPDLTLWWVSAEMVDEISHVAAELPDDVKPEDMPGMVVEGPDGLGSTRGLVILEKPMMGIDSIHPDHRVNVDGFLYGGTLLPPIHGRSWRHSTSVASYRRLDYDDGLDTDGLGAAGPLLLAGGLSPEALMEAQLEADKEGATSLTVKVHGEDWVPLGRSDWPWVDQLGERIDRSVGDQQHQSMIEDRRWLAALHLVAEDHRVATVDRVVPAQKVLRRPSERRKLGTTVRVVYLRAFDESAGKEERVSASGRHAPRAHIVRSHPRWQPYGPQAQFRKMILVPRHTRGHGGKPTEGPPTVRAVV